MDAASREMRWRACLPVADASTRVWRSRLPPRGRAEAREWGAPSHGERKAKSRAVTNGFDESSATLLSAGHNYLSRGTQCGADGVDALRQCGGVVEAGDRGAEAVRVSLELVDTRIQVVPGQMQRSTRSHRWLARACRGGRLRPRRPWRRPATVSRHRAGSSRALWTVPSLHQRGRPAPDSDPSKSTPMRPRRPGRVRLRAEPEPFPHANPPANRCSRRRPKMCRPM